MSFLRRQMSPKFERGVVRQCARGRFWWGSEEESIEHRHPQIRAETRVIHFLPKQVFTSQLSCLVCFPPFLTPCTYVVSFMAGIEQASQSAASAVPGQIIDEQSFQSKRVPTDDQRFRAISLEPAFVHLLHDVGVGEATIWALRHARINDRETFTGLVERDKLVERNLS